MLRRQQSLRSSPIVLQRMYLYAKIDMEIETRMKMKWIGLYSSTEDGGTSTALSWTALGINLAAL
ncbi:hypothetical protein CUMW_288800 [Citrus unshiu]|uniref:Uncharacterized protein n=1 Tax=Citrus unshiu TaxID=55188 RepID=A0A2H5QY24_CITUN|nr:hypothetical protein CUMW_288800 [Citrus unshiu]